MLDLAFSLSEKESTGTKVQPLVKGESVPELRQTCFIALQKRLARAASTRRQ